MSMVHMQYEGNCLCNPNYFQLEETPPVPSPRQKIYDNPQRSATPAAAVTNGTDSAKIETEINNLKTAGKKKK